MSLFKTDPKVTVEGEDNIIFLPKNVYDFCHLDDNDYTGMVADLRSFV